MRAATRESARERMISWIAGGSRVTRKLTGAKPTYSVLIRPAPIRIASGLPTNRPETRFPD